MNDLGTASITSMEVAEMTGKIHKNLIRSIETYMKHFSQLNFEPAKYFNLSTYLDEQEKERKCYNITKKGCEFIAHKMTGIKGTEFTVKYIERFHEMEQAISQQEVVEQKQEKKSLSQWTPEEIVDWKLNDLHKRLQREMRSPCSSTSKQKPRCSSTGVFYSYFLVWKGLIPQAGYRLFVTVQPFDDVMANYTSRNSDNKRNDIFHAVHLPPVPI